MLHQFISAHRDEIIDRCRTKVASRSAPPPTDLEIDHGVPMFLEQLADALRRGRADPEIGKTAVKHGHDMQLQGFTMAQVVHDYGDVCQSITELAVETDAPISTDDFRMLNGCLDDAIAGAVTEYGRQLNQSALDLEAARGNERLAILAHELRNLANTAVLAFDVLKTGNVGVAGSTGKVLDRSLRAMCTLTDRSFDEVRLTRGAQPTAVMESFLLSEFIQEIGPAATMAARAVGVTLALPALENGVMVRADRPLLAAALDNLLQNAFKFTRPRTTVTLRVVVSPERARIEVEDQCGGLPSDDVDGLFRAFEQADDDRSGLGLGLTISRYGVEASHGQLYARNLPGQGCIFTIELPRLLVPATARSEAEDTQVRT